MEHVYRYFLWALAREYWRAQEDNEELGSPGTIEQFNSSNDLSILKVIKLNFLAVAFSILQDNENNLYPYFDSFRALKYGPVEMDFWDFLQTTRTDDIISCNTSNSNISILDTDYFENEQQLRNDCNIIDPSISDLIDRSLQLINEKDARFFLMTSRELVDFTHLWDTWNFPFKKAIREKVRSWPITRIDFNNAPFWIL